MDQRRDQTGYQDVGVDDDPHSSRCCRVAAISVLISSRERRSAPASRALCCIDSIARNASVCRNADRVSSKVSGEVAERSAMGLPFDVTTICRSSSSARQTAADRLRSSRTLTKFITSPIAARARAGVPRTVAVVTSCSTDVEPAVAGRRPRFFAEHLQTSASHRLLRTVLTRRRIGALISPAIPLPIRFRGLTMQHDRNRQRARQLRSPKRCPKGRCCSAGADKDMF